MLRFRTLERPASPEEAYAIIQKRKRARILGGGLDALQNVVIIFALPFSVVVLLMMVALYRELDHERRMMGLFITPDAVPERGRPYRSYEDGDPRRGSTSGRPSSK